MPCRYVIDVEQGLVITSGWDRVTFAEIKAHQDRLANDPEFHPEFNQFIDGTAVTALEISTAEAKMIASRKFFSSKSRRALLASNLSILGMARVMQTYVEMAKDRERIAVFHEREAALEWLGVRSVAHRG
ncbi:MAG TPA: hypothetical protein VMD99_16200 [Terriglobales bacterium]|nr:hypothetical protein [Terriglobales bacterium]